MYVILDSFSDKAMCTNITLTIKREQKWRWYWFRQEGQ